MLIGHKTILDDLKSLADRGALSHSYLFFGPAMVGKKMAAWEFAAYLEKKGSEMTLSDTAIIEPGEGGSIGIDAVREIKNFLWQKPNVSPRRTLIINDAELLTAEAQNSLLKITEEPPASSLLILVTADLESLMSTILSRFQKIYFGLVRKEEMERELKLEIGNWKNAGSILEKSMGKPGLAWRLAHDEALQKNIALAEKFLKSAPAARRDLIKTIIEPEDFDFRKFLDAVILVLWWQTNNQLPKTNYQLWHKALALYDRQANFSLNPRLQLENLLA